MRKGLSLIFEGHHTKDVDSQESVLARMEKIDRYVVYTYLKHLLISLFRYLKSLENGLVTANKALEQYVENRTNLSKVVESFEKCFRERSSQEGTRMGEIFSNVAQSLAKEAHPKYVVPFQVSGL